MNLGRLFIPTIQTFLDFLPIIVTESTAIEGSSLTLDETEKLFSTGELIDGLPVIDQYMNLDLMAAYRYTLTKAQAKKSITVKSLIEVASLVMRNTGSVYHTALGTFSSTKGDLRRFNVTAGMDGHSYMSFTKVPMKLTQLCENINQARKTFHTLSVEERYDLSFDTHYDLVTIHPWADGNGRMARLLMHWLQYEAEIAPTILRKEDKDEYVKALSKTREMDNLKIFRQFMRKNF